MRDVHNHECTCLDCIQATAMSKRYPPPDSWLEVWSTVIAVVAIAVVVWIFS